MPAAFSRPRFGRLSRARALEQAPAEAPAPRLPMRDFILSLYRELLGREPEDGVLEQWAEQLPELSWDQVYLAFVDSEEYRRRKADRVPLAVPPGHFYSPIVDPREIAARAHAIFNQNAPPPAIALREAEQLALLPCMAEHYPRLPFGEWQQAGLRYWYENPAFSYGDAIVLAWMILMHRPATIVEVGSGHSSALILDMVERELNWQAQCVFIEPHVDLLRCLLQPEDAAKIEIRADRVQDVDLLLYDRLQSGDILFIDSTHIVKTGSDVVHHVGKVLPRLRPGVLIHFHDIFYPFEYPENWVIEENRSYNELYYLQAFLMHNECYQIVFFNDFMARAHADQLRSALPLFMRNPGGSLWLRKLS